VVKIETHTRLTIWRTLSHPTAIVVHITRETAIAWLLQLRPMVVDDTQLRRPVVQFIPTRTAVSTIEAVTIIIAVLVLSWHTNLSTHQGDRCRSGDIAHFLPRLAIIRGASVHGVKTLTRQAINSTNTQIIAVIIRCLRETNMMFSIQLTSPVVSQTQFGSPIVVNIITHTRSSCR